MLEDLSLCLLPRRLLQVPLLILFESDGAMWNGSQPSRRMPFRSCEEHHDFERRIEVFGNFGRPAFYVPQGMFIFRQSAQLGEEKCFIRSTRISTPLLFHSSSFFQSASTGSIHCLPALNCCLARETLSCSLPLSISCINHEPVGKASLALKCWTNSMSRKTSLDCSMSPSFKKDNITNQIAEQLKIVLEHCTTRDAIEAVNKCGPNVVGTITAHHLYLTIDDWADDPFCYW